MQSVNSVYAGDRELDEREYYTENGWGFIKRSECENQMGVSVEYTKMSPVVSSATESDFVLPLTPLCFEALVCLAASELCREQDAGKHTKLVYKYNDLCEGLREHNDRIRRNAFFGIQRKKRW